LWRKWHLIGELPSPRSPRPSITKQICEESCDSFPDLHMAKGFGWAVNK